MADKKDDAVDVEASDVEEISDTRPAEADDTQKTSPDAEETVDVTISDSSSEEPAKPEAGEPESASAPPPETEEEKEDPAMAGRTSKLEKEKNELESRLGTTLKSLDKIFTGHPELYEQWRENLIKEGGPDFGSYEQVYGSGAAQSPAQQNVQQAQTPATPEQQAMTPEQVRYMARKELEDQQGFQQFVAEVPEMDPKNIGDNEEKQQAASKTWDKVARVAAAMKVSYPTMSSGELFTAAYYSLPENKDKLIKKAEETGELVGKAKAYSKATGESGRSSGSASGKGSESVVSMTKSQKERYDYLLNRKGKKIADLYAKNVAGGE